MVFIVLSEYYFNNASVSFLTPVNCYFMDVRLLNVVSNLSKQTCFTSFSLPQLGFEINCGTDNVCVDNMKVDFNFTK